MALQDNWVYDQDYEELHEGSGAASFGADTGSATRVFLVDWQFHKAFIDDLRGYAYTEPQGVISAIRRVLPDSHPWYPEYYCTDVSVEGIGQCGHTNGVISWTKAKITAVYTPVPYEVLSDSEINTSSLKDYNNNPGEIHRYVERHYGFQTDYLTRQGTMQFVRKSENNIEIYAPYALTAQPGTVLPSQELIYVWRDVPSLPNRPFHPPNLDFILGVLGKTNNRPFDLRDPENGNATARSDSGYQPGTLLLVGVELQLNKRRLSTTINLQEHRTTWNITYKMQLRDYGRVDFPHDDGGPTTSNPHGRALVERAGWNMAWNPTIREWDVLSEDGRYRYRNFGSENWQGTYSEQNALTHPNGLDGGCQYRLYLEANYDNLFALPNV